MPESNIATLNRIHSLEQQVKKLTDLIEVMSRYENKEESLTDTRLNDDKRPSRQPVPAVQSFAPADAEERHFATLGRLTLGVAHDVNNLLNMMLGYCELMAEGLPEADSRRNYASSITDLGQQAGELLHFLTGRADRHSGASADRVVVSELFVQLQRLLPTFIGGQYRVELECLTGAQSVPLERMQAIRLMLNLVGNASAATPPGGQIKVQALRKSVQRRRVGFPDAVPVGQYAMLKVSDSGAGMSDDILKNMFEIHYTTRSESGSGIGLDVVRSIVRETGGFIQVESAPGSGTQMRIFIPV